jgi:hypothetical protein
MSNLELSLLVAMVVVLVCLGGVCVFNPHAIVKVAQQNYRRSRRTQAQPFSNGVLKPSYPAYFTVCRILCVGLCWIVDLLKYQG